MSNLVKEIRQKQNLKLKSQERTETMMVLTATHGLARSGTSAHSGHGGSATHGAAQGQNPVYNSVVAHADSHNPDQNRLLLTLEFFNQP